MSRRAFAIAAALSVLALESPFITFNANPLPRQYFNQGVKKYEAGNYRGAIDDWSKAIEINPQDAIAYNSRGIAKDNLGDYQGAIAGFNKAIKC
ncbi:tetratricopeptide repeat protein [Synechococcus sp. A15-24]|uniref:tetratricopeptide repeat protein n=1 Tax=Synechococcus sp. A15-24 TaxID=1050635 RepID=UPI001644ABF6|nr:tetratricopeptide repeat protein [Synechococcus sp. A15-24]QNJ29506.1 tetratricopeptide repeat family protein [Synechococcus sp. A15-24]